MIQLEKKYVQVFVPHIVKFSLEEIEKCCNWLVDALCIPENTKALKDLRVTFKSSGLGQDEHFFESPLGDLKVKFVKRLEDRYLGVAACFSYSNGKAEDEQFFTVYMNHQSQWVDSTGHKFGMDFSADKPNTYEAAQLIQRVLAALLQKQDKALTWEPC